MPSANYKQSIKNATQRTKRFFSYIEMLFFCKALIAKKYHLIVSYLNMPLAF